MPGWFKASEIASALKSTGLDGEMTVFGQLVANVSDEEAFVLTNVVRGLLGPSIFSIDYAAVVARGDSSDLGSAEAIESQKASVMRMVNNGGTLSARMFFPARIARSPAGSTMLGVSTTAGFLGPALADSMRFSASASLDLTQAFTISSLTDNTSGVAQLLILSRAGVALSSERILAEAGGKSLRFAQIGVGLRQGAGGQMGLSVLLSFVEDEFEPFQPRVTANFSAMR